jgi:hypothetical protein
LKDNFPQSRGFSTGVVVDGGNYKTVYLAGQNASVDEEGKSLAGNLEVQARAIFKPPRRRPNTIAGDIEMTRVIVEVAKPLGMAVHDHIIVGRDGHTGLKALEVI